MNTDNINVSKRDSDIIKLNTIEKIILLYPKLSEHKNLIIDSIVGVNDKEIKNVLTKIEIKNNIYYRYNNGLLIDKNCNIIGTYLKIDNNEYKYYIFEDMSKCL